MGAGLGVSLLRGGARVVTTVAGRSARTARLAAELTLLSDVDAVVSVADVVLLVVPPGEALAAAATVAEAARRSGSAPLIAELNAVSPATHAEIAGLLDGFDLVDGSISGPPPNVRPGAAIYLSGPRAAEIAALPWTGANPVVVGAAGGMASAVKMCTASVQKGLWGLLTHALVTAEAHGVLDTVTADVAAFLDKTDPNADLARPVASAAAKAHRYVAEMREIAATQAAAGLTPALFTAFAEAFAAVAATDLAAEDPESLPADLTVANAVHRLRPPS